MKILKLFILAFIMIGFFNSCSDIDQAEDSGIQPSLTNQNLLKQYTQISNRNKVDDHGFLYFNDIKELEEFYTNLENLSDEWDYDSDESKDYNENVEGDPAIYSYYEILDFYSLGQYYDELDLDDENYRDNVPDYIGTPILQALLSDQKEIAIGNNIFKYLEMGRVAIIEDLSIEGLNDVRENDVHSDHDKVEYFDKKDNSRYRIKPPGDYDEFDDCFTYLSAIVKTFQGSLANKVQVNGKVKYLPAECSVAVQSHIDWGDGSTSYGLNATHTYAIPSWITSEDCVEFTIKITSEWIEDCGDCEKGKKHVKFIKVELCPENDCSGYTGVGTKSKSFDYSWTGNTYRIVGEIGIDNNAFPLWDWYRNVWAKSTFYRKKLNGGWKKWTPTNLGVRLHGTVYREDNCVEYKEILEGTKWKKKKSVEYNHRSSWPRPFFSKEFEEEKIFSDHFVKLGLTNESMLNVTLWD